MNRVKVAYWLTALSAAIGVEWKPFFALAFFGLLYVIHEKFKGSVRLVMRLVAITVVEKTLALKKALDNSPDPDPLAGLNPAFHTETDWSPYWEPTFRRKGISLPLIGSKSPDSISALNQGLTEANSTPAFPTLESDSGSMPASYAEG